MSALVLTLPSALKVATTVGAFLVALKRHRDRTREEEEEEVGGKGNKENGNEKSNVTATTCMQNGHGGADGDLGQKSKPKRKRKQKQKHFPPILAGPRPCMGDLSMVETVVNLVTCVPYFTMARAVNPLKGVWNRLFSYSCSFTGVCALLYHLSTGPIRNFFRRLDYTSVALSSVSLTMAIAPAGAKPLFLGALSLAMAPFQPLVVAALHMFGTEYAFLLRALEDPRLRETHLVHTCAGVAAFGCFFGDDWFPQVPYLHASWHLLSAYATSLTPCLIR